MASCIYDLKSALRLPLLTWLSVDEKKEILMMAEFESVFYVVWWLQAFLGNKAPMNDLFAFQQMRSYAKFYRFVADKCLGSWKRHTWYLTAELVVFCLADNECPFRDDVAAALLKEAKLDVFPPGKPKFFKLQT